MALRHCFHGRIASPATLGNGVALVSTMLWASSFPATEYLLGAWDPLSLGVARLAGAALFLVTLTLATGRGAVVAGAPWRDVLLIGGLGVAAPVFLIVFGQAYSDAVTVAIIGTSLPLVAAGMAWILDGRRPGAMVVLGSVLAVIGGCLAALAGVGGPEGPRGGEILVLGAMITWIWYSRASLQRLASLGDLALSSLTFAAGALVAASLVGLVLLLGGFTPRIALDGPHLAALLWMSMLAIGLSVPLWFTAARLLGLTVAAIHTNLAPFYVMLIALAFGGSVNGQQVLGAVLVALGALLAQLAAARR